MDIITRQVRGGFRARFSDSDRFGKRGETRGDAVASLILSSRKKFGIGKVLWDKKDKWTSNYLAGKGNSKKSRPPALSLKKLPVATDSDEARQITIMQLRSRISYRLIKVLRRLTNGDDTKTLGDVCRYTEKEINEERRSRRIRNFGDKTMRSLLRLLGHYGLSLKTR